MPGSTMEMVSRDARGDPRKIPFTLKPENAMNELTLVSDADLTQIEGGALNALPSGVVNWIKSILNTPPTQPVPDKPVVAR